MKNINVIKEWAVGHVAYNHTGTLVTDGVLLWSYGLCIGRRSIHDGRTVVTDYTAAGGDFYSVTTSKHVNMAKAYAQEILPSA
jgi:hypothetical protein